MGLFSVLSILIAYCCIGCNSANPNTAIGVSTPSPSNQLQFVVSTDSYGLPFQCIVRETARTEDTSTVQAIGMTVDQPASAFFANACVGKLGAERGFKYAIVLREQPAQDASNSEEPVWECIVGFVDDPARDLQAAFPNYNPDELLNGFVPMSVAELAQGLSPLGLEVMRSVALSRRSSR